MRNLLLTPSQIAARLGIQGRSDIVADLLRRGLLPIAGQDEEGVPLVRQHYVEQRGRALLAGDFDALRSPRLRRLAIADLPPPLPCGCAIDELGQLAILCRTGRALEASARLAEAFLAAAPAEPFFLRLAAATAEAHISAAAVASVGHRTTAEPDKARMEEPERGRSLPSSIRRLK